MTCIKYLNRNGSYMSVSLCSAADQDNSGLFFPLTVSTTRFINHVFP